MIIQTQVRFSEETWIISGDNWRRLNYCCKSRAGIILVNHVLDCCCSFQLVLRVLNNGNRAILMFCMFFLRQMFIVNTSSGYHHGCNQEAFCNLNSTDVFKMHFQSILVTCWLSTRNVVESEIGCKLFNHIDKGQGREDV